MFSNLIFRNSRRSRRENGLFFGSMVISIVAFYMILAISTQDVMIFLRKMESDAVNKLLLLIPVFYGMTLCILFFLIYFACKYQLERRRHEFGVYLMLGMRRSKLFGMLLAEDVISSVLALLIGLPVAVALSETISLVTVKLVGMGILGHRFTVSATALIWTLAGFLSIKLLALLLLSGRIVRQEIGALLTDPAGGEKKQFPTAVYGLSALCGMAMLGFAYSTAIQGMAWTQAWGMGLTMLLGTAGTILLFYGMRAPIALIARAGKRRLHVFTFRQIQENVIQKSSSMAVSSLLILAALCCFGAGMGIAITNDLSASNVTDYTFGDIAGGPAEVLPKLQAALGKKGLNDRFSELLPMRIGHIRTSEDSETAFSMDEVLDALDRLPQSRPRDILRNNFGYVTRPYLISLSDYNQLLALAGKPAITLEEGEAAVYMDAETTANGCGAVVNDILAGNPKGVLSGETITLTGPVQYTDVVTDRMITLSFALILPDGLFHRHTQETYDTYVNGIVRREAESDVMSTYLDLNEQLDETGIRYESFLQNTGRQLFYTVAASYITIYLAIVFLVVANTILGVQFLMSQQKTGRRYRTLVRLGATYETLLRSAREQITWFMGLPVAVAAVSSIFGVRALFAGLLSSRARSSIPEMLAISAAMILLLCVVEYVYMAVVKRSSDRYLLTLMQPQREE